MTLSIIIPNWNTRDLITSLLRSVFKYPPASSFEVIVIDNGSTDGSAEAIEQEFSSVKLIRNDQNMGYATANNQGWEVSRGEFVLLLGSDTVIIDESLQRMVDCLRNNADIGALGCRLLRPDGSVEKSCKRFPRLRDGVLTYLSLHSLARRYNMAGFDYYRTQDVDQPPATCLMIRRTVIEQVGLFDERYTILYNDVDLCRRIRAAGWRIVFLADAEIVHHGSYSTRRTPPAIRLEMYRNILLYYFRHFGAVAVLVLLPILMLRLAVVNKGRCVIGLMSVRYLKHG